MCVANYESKLEESLAKVLKGYDLVRSKEVFDVIKFLDRNFDALSLRECLRAIQLLGSVGKDSKHESLALCVLSNVADRVTYLLASGPEPPADFLVALLRECGNVSSQSLALENVSAWLLNFMDRDVLVHEMRTLYRMRNHTGLRELIKPVVGHVGCLLNQVSLPTLCCAVDLSLALGFAEDVFVEKILVRAVKMIISGENPAAFYHTLSKLLAGEQEGSLWDRRKIRELIEKLVDSQCYPKNPSEAHLYLSAAIARSGGPSTYMSYKAYSVIEKALRFKTSNPIKNKIKLEICFAFKLPSRSLTGAVIRKDASDAARHYLTHFGAVIGLTKSSSVLSSFARVQAFTNNASASDWSCLFERIMELHETAKCDAESLAAFLIACSDSDVPISLKKTVEKSLTPLIRMRIRNESYPLTYTFLKLLLVEKGHDICESLRIEVISKTVGTLRISESPVDVSHLIKVASLLPFVKENKSVSPESKSVLQQALLRHVVHEAYPPSNKQCLNLLSLKGVEWSVLHDYAFSRIQIDQLNVEGLVAVGKYITSHDTTDDVWKRITFLNLLPEDKEILTAQDSSIQDLLAAIQRKLERTQSINRFPDGPGNDTGDLKAAFCGFLLTLTAAASFCDSKII